jgi:hypothetical protein
VSSNGLVPRIRGGLDVFVRDRTRFVLRDSYRYQDPILLPLALAPALEFFDGEHTLAELHAKTSHAAGYPIGLKDIRWLVDTLGDLGFLDDDRFRELQRLKHDAFAKAEVREAIHAGSGYPLDPLELKTTIEDYHRQGGTLPGRDSGAEAVGIASPHVSPFGGAASYGAAYRRLADAPRERTFVILGTSHYGDPHRFGLTRKAFATPFGLAPVDTAAVDWLEQRAPGAITSEDYCHAIEHSIEFQVVFLQHAIAPDVRILPILCGPLLCAQGRRPEERPQVRAFLWALAELAEARRGEIFWVLGIDLAHVGRRYGDPFSAHALKGPLAKVRRRDEERLAKVCAGDADGFAELAPLGDDDLKWCGTAPLYTFLRAEGGVRGQVLRYEQWNIDPKSVVTFAGLEFTRG